MENNDRTSVDGHPEAAAQDRLNMQPGRLEDIENATAYANRTGQTDATGDRPSSGQGERMHERDGMLAREGMADTTGNPMERGERQAGTGRDGRVTPEEDIGGGIRANPADGLADNDGRVHRGEDIGNGIRARSAGEQDPGNPLV